MLYLREEFILHIRKYILYIGQELYTAGILERIVITYFANTHLKNPSDLSFYSCQQIGK